jgi:hypothetical protein
MRIIHHVSVSNTPEIRHELADLGIVAELGVLAAFNVDEADEQWPRVQEWIARRRPLDVVETDFSKKEISEASWLALVPQWHQGYPQPNENEFGYLRATYDLANWCDECGVGAVQRAPFMFKGEPKWSRNSVLQLNWVFDEYFVRPETFADVFRSHGVDSRPVLDPNGKALKTVVQLVSGEEVNIETTNLDGRACAKCGRVKYLPAVRGKFPALSQQPSTKFVKTTAYFGSGASAHNGVLVPQAIAAALIERNVRGVGFQPLPAASKDLASPGAGERR